MAYRSQRYFPSAVGAQSADASILVRGDRRIQAACAHRFDHNRWGADSL